MRGPRKENQNERVVVTGMGLLSPLGLDVESTWRALVAGECGVRVVESFDTSSLTVKIAAQVKGFNPARCMDPREARRLSPFIQFATDAAEQAIENAGLDFSLEDPYRAGVEIGSSLGGIAVTEDARHTLDTKGPRYINPVILPAILVNTPACFVAIRHGIKGPVTATVAACATGVISLGEAAHRVARGEVNVILAGAADSVMTQLAIITFSRLGALSGRNDAPERACAPFDANREGTVVGEGAGILVLESLSHARERSARILAEIAGYGLTSDAHHLVIPDPTGQSAARAMSTALADAGLPPEEVDWVCAHGTATLLNDAAETEAIKLALGDHAYRVPVSSLKGSVGHMLGAAGLVSAVAAVKAIECGMIPPTLNYETPDPQCDLDYVPNIARRADVRTVMLNGFGFGGQNASLIVRRWEE
jgi:3-oxoacyl-[acyl-carrier-protein] synthase II